jgi:hypothetical protein
MKATKNIFSIESQYQLYLQRIQLKEENMHPQQRVQLRQTFYGACGQMLLLLRDDLACLEEKHGVLVLQDMMDQVQTYFLNAIKNDN